MRLLECKDLRKTYAGPPAVDGVSLTVESGEVLGLLGPNGAGKTTTMMMIAGLLEPDSGQVLIEGKPFSGQRSLRAALGVVPQELAIYPELTARENLKFFGGLYGVTGSKLEERISAVLLMTGLTEQANARVDTFSGGMKRRLNFGVAALHEPRLLILDEPTVGVDPQSRAHLLASMKTLSRQGMGVIYASHYMEEVQAVCDRVAILDRGRVITCDTLEALLDRVSGVVEVKVAHWKPELTERVAAWAEVQPGHNGEAVLFVAPNGSGDAGFTSPLGRLLAGLDELGVAVQTIRTRESNLEQLFLNLTGRELRD